MGKKKKQTTTTKKTAEQNTVSLKKKPDKKTEVSAYIMIRYYDLQWNFDLIFHIFSSVQVG